MALQTKSIALLLLGLILGSQAGAVEVSFPTEELPNEVVVPVLDSREAVKSRLVRMTGRFDAQLGMGWILDEPFYQNRYIKVTGLYHANEKIGFGAGFLSASSGLSDYGTQFGASSPNLNFSRAPALKSALSGIFHYRLMYGKVSWGKDTITPVSYHATTELSFASYGSRSLPWLSGGIGQRIFFSKNWGTDVTMQLMYRQQINPLSNDIKTATTTKYTDNDFGTKAKVGADIKVGVYFLL